MNARCLDLDLHRLDLRFAGTRVTDQRAVERMTRSIERGGQIVPCIAVADQPVEALEGGARLVLVDGYRRIAALRRLGRDTARVECWACSLAEAVLGVLVRSRGRPFTAIEEALLVRELVQAFGLSQHEVARRCGRDVSWVSRRLQLLSGLPDAVLMAVIEGRLSAWAASRVVAPLARANSDHADQLLKALSNAPLSTRELCCWFDQYQKASRIARDRLVSYPHLFIAALEQNLEQCRSERLQEGPEGICEIDLRRMNVLIRSVRKRLPDLCPLSQDLLATVTLVQRNFEGLCRDIKRYANHDPHGDSQQRARSQGARPEPARDQPPAQALAQYGASHPA
jgi:ParB family transcriptional regulator, chromosome partitioning protein